VNEVSRRGKAVRPFPDGSQAPYGTAPAGVGPERTNMRTLVVSSSPSDLVSTRLRGVLRARVDSAGPAIADHDEAERLQANTQAEMIAVVLSPDPEQGLDTSRRMRRGTTGYVLAVGQASEPKLILRALHDGADHYLDEAELETGIDAVLARLKSKNDT